MKEYCSLDSWRGVLQSRAICADIKEVNSTNSKGLDWQEGESSPYPPYSPNIAPSDFHIFAPPPNPEGWTPRTPFCGRRSKAFTQELADRHATSDAFMRKAVLVINNLLRTNRSGVKDTHTRARDVCTFNYSSNCIFEKKIGGITFVSRSVYCRLPSFWYLFRETLD